jgi:LPP20 lipoprotein
MSRKVNLLLMSTAVLAIAACTTATAPAPAPLPPVAECVFPNSSTAAPLWVCDAPVDGMAVGAVGSFPKSGAGIDFMKTQAAASARVKLAQQMKVQVAAMIKQYAETTGAGKEETVDQVYTAVSKQITNETLVGTRVFRSAQGPDGTMYVLVGVDPASTQKITEAAVQTSMNNDRALWQKFQAGKAHDELAAEIAKQKADPNDVSKIKAEFDKNKQ